MAKWVFPTPWGPMKARFLCAWSVESDGRVFRESTFLPLILLKSKLSKVLGSLQGILLMVCSIPTRLECLFPFR